MADLDSKDYQKRAEFDRMMTAATVYRQRGDYGSAGDSIVKALELFPADPKAREFAADLLFAKGQLEKAASEYKRLFEEDQTRTSAEAKYAKTMIQIAEGNRQQDLLQQILDNPQKFRKQSTRSPLIAALVSIAPGFGQIYCGQTRKGIIICAVTIFFWFLAFTLIGPVIGSNQAQKLEYFANNMDPLAVIFGCIALFTHMYAMVDAPVYAGKMGDRVQDLSEGKSLSS